MQSFLLDRVTLLYYIVTLSMVTCLYMSDVKLIKVYEVISDPGLTFTQSPIIDEYAGPLTFASALHRKIQANLRKKVEITNFPYNLYFHLYYKKRIFH